MKRFTVYLAVALAAASALAGPAFGGSQQTVTVASPVELRPTGATGKHLLVATPTGIGCRVATAEEAASIARRSADDSLHVIYGENANKTATGLTIVLRATSQLESFPAAKNAFIRAAADWEGRIANPITIIVDVDFGPKRFGVPYEPLVIGSTDAQDLVGDGLFSQVRGKLVSGASGAAETALYATLPSSSVPTDGGSTSTMSASSANLRALGLISAVANPPNETNFGDPPSIGFNSGFAYDFDPSNGIDANKTDFNAAAVHEIGHVLGFESNVGFQELGFNGFGLTVLDLFRFRPGVTSGTFSTASRILTSGGTQVFFAGSSSLGFSTGRPDGSGGDQQQASHWKDDFETGTFIGIMDPTIDDGQQEDITANDVRAFDTIGYRFGTSGTGVTLSGLASDLASDKLTITGSAASAANITGAEVTLLDLNNAAVATLPTVALTLGTSGTFTLEFTGLGDRPAAVKARLVISDAAGNESAATVVDFSGASAGGPVVTKTKIKNGKLKVTGTGFATTMQVEVNGVAVALPAGSTVKATGLKAAIKLAGLTLRSGPNRIRLLLDGKHSNILVLTT